VDKECTLLGGKKAVLADAIGAAICAPIGTSTVTSFAESGIAVETGAKTGLAAVTAGVLFLLSAFIYPVFSIFSSYAVTSMALISVGALMFFGNLRDINWDDRVVVYTAFITIVMMILTYSISDGLGFGLILYIAMMLARKQGKQISPTLYVVGVLFLTYYVLKVFIK
jgi:AGZA family xanthine/uracil permease-like MFS transporter